MFRIYINYSNNISIICRAYESFGIWAKFETSDKKFKYWYTFINTQIPYENIYELIKGSLARFNSQTKVTNKMLMTNKRLKMFIYRPIPNLKCIIVRSKINKLFAISFLKTFPNSWAIFIKKRIIEYSA